MEEEEEKDPFLEISSEEMDRFLHVDSPVHCGGVSGGGQEREEFLLVEDDRMDDILILSSSENEEQETCRPEGRAASAAILPGNIDLKSADQVTKDDVTPVTQQPEGNTGPPPGLEDGSVEIGCQTELEQRPYSQMLSSFLESTYSGGKCLTEGVTQLLSNINIGNAPGQFTGTLREDLLTMKDHLTGVLQRVGREISPERIRYKLFL